MLGWAALHWAKLNCPCLMNTCSPLQGCRPRRLRARTAAALMPRRLPQAGRTLAVTVRHRRRPLGRSMAGRTMAACLPLPLSHQWQAMVGGTGPPSPASEAATRPCLFACLRASQACDLPLTPASLLLLTA